MTRLGIMHKYKNMKTRLTKHNNNNWQDILNANPSYVQLLEVMEFAHNKYKKQAWSILVSRGATHGDIEYITKYAPLQWKLKAIKYLRKTHVINK